MSIQEKEEAKDGENPREKETEKYAKPKTDWEKETSS